MDNHTYILLGIKVAQGPIERHKIENFTLENTVSTLKNEAEKRTNVPSSSLELIYHGKILRDNETLHDSGIKSGEMVHVLKKKSSNQPAPPPSYTIAQMQELCAELRTLGSTPNAIGWTRAMQLLNNESVMAEIMDQVPSLADDCMTLSILHDAELLAALGTNFQTMRLGAHIHPHLPHALRILLQMVRSRSNNVTTDPAPTSGFAYSLEALSEDEDVEEEETEEGESRNPITQELLAAALRVATEAALSSNSRGQDGLQAGPGAVPVASTAASGSGAGPRPAITPEMFSEAITEAMHRTAATNPAGTPLDQSFAASSSQSPEARDEDFSSQLQRMHEMGLLDDALNVRALLICGGDVNAAINLVFSGAIGDD